MSKAPAFQYYAKDHIASKASLTIPERGAWSTLVDHCWENGEPISMALAIRLVGSEMIESIRFLLRVESDTVTFDWIEETRSKQAEKSAINAANGKNGGRGKSYGSKAKSERFTKSKRTLNETKPFRAAVEVEVEDTQKIKEPAQEATVWPSFMDFWNIYDRKRGKPEAETQWGRITQAEREAVMAAVPNYVLHTPKEFRKDPERYLSKRAWNDEVIPRNTQTNGQSTSDQRSANYERILAERYPTG